MDPVLFLAFVTTTFVFIALPGPSVAFATAQAVRHGKRAAFVAVAGDALGTMVHIVVAVAGVTALVSLSQAVLPILQMIGGVFIVLMALHAFSQIGRDREHSVSASDKVTFWAGFFACVTNPKAIVFFAALFPAFISPEHSLLLQGLVYGLIFIVLDAISILAYALLTRAAVEKAKSRWLNGEFLSGMGLSVVGMGMIVKGYRALPSSN